MNKNESRGLGRVSFVGLRDAFWGVFGFNNIVSAFKHPNQLQKEWEWLRLSMATLMDMAPYVIAAGYMAVRAPETVTISVTVAVAAAKAVVDKRSRDQRNG